MPADVNLFAICRTANGPTMIKRVQIAREVQGKLSGIFRQQASSFLEGIDEEIEFGVGWKPDVDEILYIDSASEQENILNAVANVAELETLNADRISLDSIKGLFVVNGTPDAPRVLVQAFTAQQNLERRGLALIFQSNTFREVSEPAFTLSSNLCAIIEGGRIKFKSFHVLKRVLKLESFYTEATDAQIDAFCGHGHFSSVDVAAIKAACSQPIRSLINAVSKTSVLDQVTVEEISRIADALSVSVVTDGEGKIVLPTSRRELKYLLSFLDDRIYEGPLSNIRLLANSKRPHA